MLETTPATVARAAAAGQPAEPIPDLDFDWHPHPLDRTVTARRTYRWPIVVGAVIVGFGLLVGIRFGLAVPAHNASLRQAEYLTAVDDYEAVLDRLDSAATANRPWASAEFATATVAGGRRAPPRVLHSSRPDLGRRARLEGRHRGTLSDEVSGGVTARRRAGSRRCPAAVHGAEQLIDPAAKALAAMGRQSAGMPLDDDPAYESYRLSVERDGELP
jgi:hypothetical protein